MNLQRIRTWSYVLPLVVACLSAAILWWIVARADRDLCDDLLQQAHTVARSINRNAVRNLTGTPTDVTNPDYQQLKEQFCAFRVAYPRSRFIYLMGRAPTTRSPPPDHASATTSATNQPVFFYVDSENITSKDYAAPGTLYSDIDPSCYRVFDTQVDTIRRYSDRWGKWVSAFVPLLDPYTKKPLGVLGMDIDVRAWHWDLCVKAGKALAALLLAMLLAIGMGFLIIERKTRLAGRKFRSYSFATKILLCLCLSTVMASLVSSWPISSVSEQYQLRQMRDWLKSLAETSAAFIDGDQFAQLTRPDQHGNAEWQAIAHTLRRFQQNSPAVRYIYTMAKRPDTDQTGFVQFVVDPTPEGDVNGNGVIDPQEAAARLGEAYNARQLAPRLLDGFTVPTCDDELTKDKWGMVLSGYAPIRNAQGLVVGLVGIDLAAEHLAALRHAFRWQCFIVVIAVILASLIIALMLSRHLARPLTALRDSIHKVAAGDFETRLEFKTGDEFEKLSDAFNAMTADLKDREFMRHSLTRYMNHTGRQHAQQRGAHSSQVAERRRITVLACDLPGLAALADSCQPEEITTLFQACHKRLLGSIARHGGVVTQLHGDGLLALFGAPLAMQKPEQQAVLAALEMQKIMTEVRA